MDTEIEDTQTVVSDDDIYYLTKYEYTRLSGYREEQLNSGAVPFVSLTADEYRNSNVHQIFLKELNEKKMPFKIRRILPNGKTLEIPVGQMDISLLKNL